MHPLARNRLISAVLLLVAATHAPAQDTSSPAANPRSASASVATGSIVGRVRSATGDAYLERVRVTVEGLPFETFTDADGAFRLDGVPAGAARIRLFYTGMAPHAGSVAVRAGQPAQYDVTLSGSSQAGARGDVVKLDQFVVSTTAQMDASALAINEQRFAANIRNVVATDEFGTVAEGHAGEFMKFLPGVSMTYAGGNAREISLQGVPGAYVPVTVGGFSLATAATNGTTRTAAVDMVSINGISRIEVSFSPTPDTPGMALAGSVNMVPRSAFERSHPILNVSA